MRLSRRTVTVTAIAAAALTAISIAGPATAAPRHQKDDHLTPRTEFTMAPDGSSGLTEGGAGIPNIDSVKSTIRKYYNATSAGIADKTSSPYITELHQIEAAALAKLPAVDPTAKKAIVFDSDDTTLWTYDMEDNLMHFNFDPALQATWVFDMKFPATPGMVDFVQAVADKGYTVFGITGRRHVQQDATIGNLEKVGYTQFADSRFFTKWDGADSNKPAYVTCAAACTTVEYKANTRKHIEEGLGYDIALNVGDQFSDLLGGYADATLKLPNPTYYLPSPDLAGLDEPTLAPRSEFTMKPDGSSGLTAGGEGIPNIDSVKSTIRTYYNASSSGIANKTSSPYITEVTGLARQVTNTYVSQCKQLVRKGEKPAVVFDADDTTLWTYDMEDNAMHFNFDPVMQNDDWVQPQKFPATPGMVSLVNAIGAAGCTVVGLTGRNDTQRDATLGNLAKVGYTQFTADNYYTKWKLGVTSVPSWMPVGSPCFDGVCTTIEYKSAVRAHVASQGYDIIGNFGDQFSDLIGGYSDSTVKLPNPTYYLP